MNLQFAHKLDTSIVYTHNRVTARQFADYWNAYAKDGNDNPMAAANLEIAARKTPDEQTLKDLLGAEWSSMPVAIVDHMLFDAGFFGLRNAANETHGERVDVVALLAAIDAIETQDGNAAADVKADPHYVAHVNRLESIGATRAMIRQWCMVRHAQLKRVIIALPEYIGGYYVGRVPSLDDRIAAQNIRNAAPTDSESGHFDSLCRLVLDCCLWSASMNVAGLIEHFPGSMITLGIAVRELGKDSFVAEQKK